ncbi:MAG: hypothetical protein FWH56_05025, partial [Betaproteobacteria bacterium]|nr:hypothetical protein [Betaproteobacteria bacterium]
APPPSGFACHPSREGNAPTVSSRITKSLGKNIGEFIQFSPSLLNALEPFFNNGGTILYGPKKGGSCYRSSYIVKEKGITVVESIVIDGSLKGNALAVLQTLSHEAGHAAFPFKFDLTSMEAFLKSLVKGESSAAMIDPRVAYLRNRIKDEGAAVVKNIEIRHEFLTRLGVDIGLTGSPANHRFYKEIHAKLGNTPAAWETIGAKVAETERSHIRHHAKRPNLEYQSYYGLWETEYQTLMELLGRIGMQGGKTTTWNTGADDTAHNDFPAEERR